jgi:hypothetical protein
MTENNTTNYLLIINDGPYGNERPYNALRLAMNIAKREETYVRVFFDGRWRPMHHQRAGHTARLLQHRTHVDLGLASRRSRHLRVMPKSPRSRASLLDRKCSTWEHGVAHRLDYRSR